MRSTCLRVGLGLALLIACGSGTNAQGLAEANHGDFEGLLQIDGGRKLYLACRGSGEPTVILEAGLRNRGDIWSVVPARGEAVLPAVATFTKVCAYDRPGTTLGTDQFSRSDSVPQPRTAKDAVAELHALLAAAPIPPPYVLVGHSTGGLLNRLYASTYPSEVVGLVLVDAISEGVKLAMTSESWTLYNRLLLTEPPKAIATYKDLETIDFDASFVEMAEASNAAPLRPIPLIVISKGKPFQLPLDLPPGLPETVETAWLAGQNYLALLLPDIPHLTAKESSHYVEIEQPQIVIDAIRQVVDKVRAKRQAR